MNIKIGIKSNIDINWLTNNHLLIIYSNIGIRIFKNLKQINNITIDYKEK